MEDFTVLDQITQNVSATAFRGKLGFSERDETALSTACTLVVQTLEEFGHEVDQFHAKRAHRVTLECDHYIVDLRHRRSPAPMRQSDGVACRCQLDVTFTPRFPERTDAELTEMLLARSLQALLSQLDASSVEWLDTAVILDRDAFLSAFAAETAEPAEDVSVRDIQLPITDPNATAVPQPTPEETDLAQPIRAYDTYAARQGTSESTAAPAAPHTTAQPGSPQRFAPVEETFGSLTEACDRIIERRDGPRPARHLGNACRKLGTSLSKRGWTANTTSAWVLTLVMTLLALPLGITAAAVNLVRGGDMRFSVQMLAVMALLMFLQSSGLVHAALY
ncbi:hypothetical protein MHM88_11425 [Epibacterium sp. MM17-32]|uniref:hypothetical protein n=1 Tax=Epibacterium sp. MM17-32 TaxID=2917734 RepID=UPI001EF42AD9|nr:hypothetical protein [Epibacterium sp. MM17-32]MCG7628417.1 hypothetical protein [Epibacterium sp. MM17-32]